MIVEAAGVHGKRQRDQTQKQQVSDLDYCMGKGEGRLRGGWTGVGNGMGGIDQNSPFSQDTSHSAQFYVQCQQNLQMVLK